MNPVSVIVTYDDGDLSLTNMSIRLLEIEGTLGFTAADYSGWSFSAPPDTSGFFSGAKARRVYTLTYEVTDAAGRTGTCSGKVKTANK